ncbi:unnamed protein product [Trichogramma brassicae]|uniref:Uncharacterized protein n=1 Tax=Trichogramma brassicae TaxID=86971 RepID=A0A6H5IHH7_9HYME|nr:unnamed protein product [Trichogramma brassicae]
MMTTTTSDETTGHLDREVRILETTRRSSRDLDEKFSRRRLGRAATWRRNSRDDDESERRPGGELNERMTTTTIASREREEKFSRRRLGASRDREEKFARRRRERAATGRRVKREYDDYDEDRPRPRREILETTRRSSRDLDEKFSRRRLGRAATWRRNSREGVESERRPGGELSERMTTTTIASYDFYVPPVLQESFLNFVQLLQKSGVRYVGMKNSRAFYRLPGADIRKSVYTLAESYTRAQASDSHRRAPSQRHKMVNQGCGERAEGYSGGDKFHMKKSKVILW